MRILRHTLERVGRDRRLELRIRGDRVWAGLGWSVATEAHPRVGSGRAAGNTNRNSHQGAQASQLPHAGGGVAGGWSCEVGGRVGRGPNRMGVGESKELEGGWVGCPQDGDRCGGLRALRGGTLSTRCNTAGRPPSGCRRRHTYAHCTDQETRLRAALNRMHGPLAAGSSSGLRIPSSFKCTVLL